MIRPYAHCSNPDVQLVSGLRGSNCDNDLVEPLFNTPSERRSRVFLLDPLAASDPLNALNSLHSTDKGIDVISRNDVAGLTVDDNFGSGDVACLIGREEQDGVRDIPGIGILESLPVVGGTIEDRILAEDRFNTVIGLLLLLIMVLSPDGLTGIIVRIKDWIGRLRDRGEPDAGAAVAQPAVEGTSSWPSGI